MNIVYEPRSANLHKQDIDLNILNRIPIVNKPVYKLTFRQKLFHTIVISLAYLMLIKTNILGATLITPVVNRFSLAISHEGSIISVGKMVLMWVSIGLQILLKNKLINIGHYGRRKQSSIVEKLGMGTKLLVIFVHCLFKTYQIYINPSRWQLYNKTYLNLFFIYCQYVFGGILLVYLDNIYTAYGFKSIKYSLIIDSAKCFWIWTKHYRTMQLESGFEPRFTLLFSLFIAVLTLLLFRQKRMIELQSTQTTHMRIKQDMGFMLGDTDILIILSTLKQMLLKLVLSIESVFLLPIERYLPDLYTFLRANEPFYYYLVLNNWGQIIVEVIYVTILFFCINYLWLKLLKLGGPLQFINQLQTARLRPVGSRTGTVGVQKHVAHSLYDFYFKDAFLLYLLVLISNIFSLVGQSNNTSFIVFIVSVKQLWQQIKQHIPDGRFKFLDCTFLSYV